MALLWRPCCSFPTAYLRTARRHASPVRDLFPNRWWTALWLSCLLLLAVLPFVANDYVVGIGLSVLMWLALTQSWCLLSKMTGYVSLGHVVFYGLGAYLVVVTWQQIPLPLAIVGAGALMGCVAIGALFSLAVFLQPMSEATGWSRTGISSAMTLDFLAMGVAAFGWGGLSDRFGPRIVVLS
eukprot:gene10683-14325_t